MSYEDLRTWAEIDLARLDENYREIRRVLPEGCRPPFPPWDAFSSLAAALAWAA